MPKLEEILRNIEPTAPSWRAEARKRLDALAIPKGSLGHITELAEKLVSITENMTPQFSHKEIFVMAGDHGIAEEGISLFPREVTVEMIGNFIKGGAGINAFAQNAGAVVNIVDMGVNADLEEIYGRGHILPHKIAYGTENISKKPAMTRNQAIRSLEIGIELAMDAKARGAELIATGDMGIGNTTPCTAIFAVLSGKSPKEITGCGTGLNKEAVCRKAELIQRSIDLHCPNPHDPIDILAKVGGFEIGGIAGLILGAANCHIPVLVDGFISTTGALLASALAPSSRDYMIAAHRSEEKAHRAMLEHLKLSPLLSLGLRLGEGTGAALAMPLIDAAAAMLQQMLTFEEANVHSGQ